MKTLCILMLFLCACRAFGEDMSNGEEQVQESNFDEYMNGLAADDVNQEEAQGETMHDNDELASDNIEDNEQEENDNVSKESFAQVMSKSYDETANAEGNKPSNKSVCYLRICKWITKKMRVYSPAYTSHNYTHTYPVTVKVPQKSTYVCGQIGYTVSKPYQLKVPQRQKTCHVYGGHKYCSHKTLYVWVTKYRILTLYKPKICSRTTYKVTIVYKTRTLTGTKPIYKYRYETIKRYICGYQMGGYYNPSNW